MTTPSDITEGHQILTWLQQQAEDGDQDAIAYLDGPQPNITGWLRLYKRWTRIPHAKEA